MRTDLLADALAECEPRVRVYFRRRCNKPEDVEDFVQECMVAALSSYHRFSGRSSIQTWMYAICKNVLRNRAYYARRDAELLRRIGNSFALRSNNEEELIDLRAIIEDLPRSQQQLCHLYYVEGRRISELSGLLERPTGTVKHLLHRLRKHVAALLAEPAPTRSP